jgi:hypothetical protein
MKKLFFTTLLTVLMLASSIAQNQIKDIVSERYNGSYYVKNDSANYQ